MHSRRGNVLIRTKQSLHGPTVGGEGRLMRRLALALHESGWEVEVLCPKPRPSATERPLPIEYHNFDYYSPETFRERVSSSFRGARTLFRILEANDYDVFLDSVANIPFYPAYALVPPETTKALYIHSALGAFSWRMFNPVTALGSNLVEQSYLLSNSTVICNGESINAVVNSYLGNANTRVLRTCIDVSQFDPRYDSSSKTVLSLGRLSPEKNVECLLKAWSLLDDFSDYTLKIAGSGERERRLRRLSDELNLRNVDFLGYTDGPEKTALFRDALVFVLPSLFEGYATTGLEALASKTPVIGANTNGIKDYVEHGYNGYLFERDDHRDLARVMRKALRQPEDLRKMAERGRATAEQHAYEEFRERADSLFLDLVN